MYLRLERDAGAGTGYGGGAGVGWGRQYSDTASLASEPPWRGSSSYPAQQGYSQEVRSSLYCPKLQPTYCEQSAGSLLGGQAGRGFSDSASFQGWNPHQPGQPRTETFNDTQSLASGYR